MRLGDTAINHARTPDILYTSLVRFCGAVFIEREHKKGKKNQKNNNKKIPPRVCIIPETLSDDNLNTIII